ncbi:RNase adapter RapZ, partial [Listeria monocytogenes]
MRFVVVSGQSGAGKTTARFALEDLGYFSVDNLPPALWESLLQHLEHAGVEKA